MAAELCLELFKHPQYTDIVDLKAIRLGSTERLDSSYVSVSDKSTQRVTIKNLSPVGKACMGTCYIETAIKQIETNLGASSEPISFLRVPAILKIAKNRYQTRILEPRSLGESAFLHHLVSGGDVQETFSKGDVLYRIPSDRARSIREFEDKFLADLKVQITQSNIEQNGKAAADEAFDKALAEYQSKISELLGMSWDDYKVKSSKKIKKISYSTIDALGLDQDTLKLENHIRQKIDSGESLALGHYLTLPIIGGFTKVQSQFTNDVTFLGTGGMHVLTVVGYETDSNNRITKLILAENGMNTGYLRLDFQYYKKTFVDLVEIKSLEFYKK